jgi:hypothetical protein
LQGGLLHKIVGETGDHQNCSPIAWKGADPTSNPLPAAEDLDVVVVKKERLPDVNAVGKDANLDDRSPI